MAEHGLPRSPIPARAFLGRARRARARAASSPPTLEGTRPLLVEVQALVAPRRLRRRRGGPPSGIDPNRLALLVAVLGRRAGIGLGSHDVYANLAGGLTRRRAGASTCRSRWRSPRRCATGRSRPAPWPSARSACWASCGRSAASSGACARRRAWASRGPIVPRRREPAPRRLRTRSPAWSVAGRGDASRDGRSAAPARLTGDAAGRRGRVLGIGPASHRRTAVLVLAGHHLMGRVHSYRSGSWAPRSASFVGARLAATGDRGLFSDRRVRPGFILAAWIVAWLDRRLRGAALPHGRARRLAHPRASRSSRRPSSWPPSSACSSACSWACCSACRSPTSPDRSARWLPLGVSLVLGLGMMGLTVAKRDDLIAAAEALGLLPAARPADRRRAERRAAASSSTRARIIDGRIADIVESGFLYGTLDRAAVRARGAAAHRRHVRTRCGATAAGAASRSSARSRRTSRIAGRDHRRGRRPRSTEVDAKLVALAKRARRRRS